MEGHGLDWEPPLSHGYKVGVGTVASCALWEEALRLDLEALDVDAVVASARTEADVHAAIERLLPERIHEEARKGSMAKHIEGEVLRERLISMKER